jgi:hypothetical protein
MGAVPDLVAIGVTDVRIFMPIPASRHEFTEQLGRLVAAFRETVAASPGRAR